jgi:O-acetyl-ADP-ribose deacetylase
VLYSNILANYHKIGLLYLLRIRILPQKVSPGCHILLLAPFVSILWQTTQEVAMHYHINHGSIEICQGDIADQETAAVVNAANNLLWMGSGVAGALKRKGGPVIEQEAMALGPAEIGTAVLTSGGSLKAGCVIHAVVMGQNMHTDAGFISAATRASLDLAEERRLESISFPALGTGVGAFSIFHCARIMLDEAIKFLADARNVRLVRFVLFDRQAADAFKEELSLQFSSKRHA